MKKPILLLITTVLIVLLVATNGVNSVSSDAQSFVFQETPEKPEQPPSTPEAVELQRVPAQAEPDSPVDQAIREAFAQTVQERRQQNAVIGLMVFDPVIDYIQHSQDGSAALLWVGLVDPETGELAETEPGLIVARTQGDAPRESAAAWSITMPSDDPWINQMQSLPQDLITDEIRMRYLEAPQPEAAAAQIYTGYKLPWAAGLEKRVTNSIGHYLTVSGGLTSCPATCKYAYDFADGTMFPILASRGGTVKSVKWTCANGTESCTNYLILEDQSTIPTTYQVYYHLAYNSIPQKFRVVGTPVRQGEYIGDADDTGYSTGHHLHYHIYITPNSSNWSWGNSVEFTYDDVAENGGRPRTCAEASQYPNLGSQCRPNNRYVSGNTPANPPSATLNAPAHRSVITSRTVTVSGTATDDIKVKRIQVLANYDGTWKSLGDIATSGSGPFSKSVDLCASGAEIPDGPFALTVKVFDHEGSQAPGVPVRQLIKNFKCGSSAPPAPVSACTPGDNQVALYSDPDYQGECKVFDVNGSGGYQASALVSLGDNQASSVQVGSGVRAVLYDRSDDIGALVTTGRIETLEQSDPGLTDNRIGDNRVSGLRVMPRSQPPEKPYFNQPTGMSLASSGLNSVESLVLSWEGGAGATTYDVRLTGPGANWTRTTTDTSLPISNLPAGTYTLEVTARNSAGGATTSKTFSVNSAALPSGSTRSVPYSENWEGGAGEWTGTGLWRYGSFTANYRPATKAWIFNDGTDYDSSAWRAGDLTSPPIAIPASGTHYLRFSYVMDVENGFPHWDQRRVQISANGGPFTDLVVLSNDEQEIDYWLGSGAISLADYAGQTIRVRFHFDTVDEEHNSGKGWIIDDVSITNNPPNTACYDGGSESAEAVHISINSTVQGAICPERDLDFYSFTGLAGQSITLDVDARTLSPASKLDPVLYLLDGDGQSILAMNDDEVYSQKVDPLLRYSLTRDGVYYVKIKAWNYPGTGSTEHFYDLKLTADSAAVAPSTVRITYPLSSKYVPTNQFTVTVSAADYDGGPVASVDFFWHGPDWNIPNWVKLSSDTNGADGWSVTLDPDTYGNVKGSALYVQANSRTGGVRGQVWWDLEPDLTVPVSKLAAQSATPSTSTAIRLTWSASDTLNDITRFELQYQENGGAWKNAPGNPIPGENRSTWFVGKPGITYGFRLRAVDRSNNVESYPASAEAVKKIEAVCTADAREPDSTSTSNSILVARNGLTGQYNLCKSGQPAAADEDWLAIKATKGERLLLWAQGKGGGAGLKISVYRDSATLLQSWVSPGFGEDTIGLFTAPETRTYYVKIEPFRSDLLGTQVYYRFWHGLAQPIHLPIIRQKQ